MSTYTTIIYQVVFATKHRAPVLLKCNRHKLFKYISALIKNKSCKVFQINGVEDHLHIAFALHPSIALADLVKDIKLATSEQIKIEGWFPDFSYWAVGYGAFTYSYNEKQRLIAYIKNQEEHHKLVGSKEEYLDLLQKYEVKYEERFVE